MHNKRHGMNRENYRRQENQQANQKNYAAEDNKKQFQDQDYDRYFPEQNSYHPRNEASGYGSSYGFGTGYGSNQDYSNQNNNPTFGIDNQTQRGNEYPNQRNANRSDYVHQSQGQNSSFGQTPYGQNTMQSWSQPVRNDEVPQSNTHFGKGPKGFKRSDDRIREEVSEALFHDHAVDASEIEVSVNDGEVTLSGTVSERRMKRLAEDCVDNIIGVKDVRNEIRVHSSIFADRSEKTGSIPNTEESTSDRLSTSDKSKAKSPNKLM